MNTDLATRTRGIKWWQGLVLIPIALILSPMILVILVFVALLELRNLVRRFRLPRKFREKWSSQGRFILFIHSDSPVWSPYLENELFPQIRDHCVFLNWSERKQWEKVKPLEARMLVHFGGENEFNPMAIVVPSRGSVQEVRFYRAFHDFKHGKEARLREREAELFELIKKHAA